MTRTRSCNGEAYVRQARGLAFSSHQSVYQDPGYHEGSRFGRRRSGATYEMHNNSDLDDPKKGKRIPVAVSTYPNLSTDRLCFAFFFVASTRAKVRTVWALS
jgi:hypothetical protein